MQLDETTLASYKQKAPELLAAVEQSSESPWIMKKDAQSGYCVKYEGGLCGIHKKYGDGFLGDACHFYPRATRLLGQSPLMTAALSCPEISRIALYDGWDEEFSETSLERLPHTLKNYLPEGIEESHALSVHNEFLRAAREGAPAEIIFARVASVGRSLEMIDRKSWADAVPFYLRTADMRLLTPEADEADHFKLLLALCGLIVATQKPMGERLEQTVSEIEKSLDVKIDWQNITNSSDNGSSEAYGRLKAIWQQNENQMQNFMRRYLHMQLSLALFPFAGLGQNISERATIIGVRLATIKLALMSACGIYGPSLPQEIVVRVVQSLSRFMDHLGDPAFSLRIYAEAGWTKESRLRGLLSV